MSRLIRRRSISRSISARTTGKLKRQIKRKILPGYGKKGAGVIKNPKKSMYNAIYHRTTIDSRDLFKKQHTHKSKSTSKTSDDHLGFGCSVGLVFAGLFVGQAIGGNIGGTIGVIIMTIFVIIAMFS